MCMTCNMVHPTSRNWVDRHRQKWQFVRLLNVLAKVQLPSSCIQDGRSKLSQVISIRMHFWIYMDTFLKVISLRIIKNSIKCSSFYRHFFILSFYIISLIGRNLHFARNILQCSREVIWR